MTGAWRLIGTSVQGSVHARRSVPCQDAYASDWDAAPSHFPANRFPIVFAVADGAGSAPRAAEGAAVAAHCAVSTVREFFPFGQRHPVAATEWQDRLAEALEATVERFLASADALVSAAHSNGLAGNAVSDLATTLTVVLVSPPWLCAVSIGDGWVVTRSGADQFDLLDPPDPTGNYANQTTFLTSPRAIDRARKWVLWDPELSGVAASTDGLNDAALEFDGSIPVRPHAGFFRPWFNSTMDPDCDAMKLSRFLASERLCRDAEDDKTLAIAAIDPSR